jgi:hypothetical protein
MEQTPDSSRARAKFDRRFASRLRTAVALLSVMFVFGVGLLFAHRIFSLAEDSDAWQVIALTNLPAVVGVPLIAVFAFMIVVVMEKTTDGEVSVKMPGFHFQGPSGPIIMWVICFLALVGAVRLLWQGPIQLPNPKPAPAAHS